MGNVILFEDQPVCVRVPSFFIVQFYCVEHSFDSLHELWLELMFYFYDFVHGEVCTFSASNFCAPYSLRQGVNDYVKSYLVSFASLCYVTTTVTFYSRQFSCYK